MTWMRRSALALTLVPLALAAPAEGASLTRANAEKQARTSVLARGVASALEVSCGRGQRKIPCSVRFVATDGRPCVVRLNVRRTRQGKLRSTEYRTACRPAPAPAPPAAPPPTLAPPPPATAVPPLDVPPFPFRSSRSTSGFSEIKLQVGTTWLCYPGRWWPSPYVLGENAYWYIAPEGYAWRAFGWACIDDNVSVFAYFYWDGTAWRNWTSLTRGLYQGPT
ncbi:MAG: hypothetical protein JWO90_268 [Solirubrobacterales bacterium]|jgi:hypothetical protein|nr:hypothetical protein [Solirubrobacterales bacterium]